MTTTAPAVLPLTTIFSAPSSCFSTLTYDADSVVVLGSASDCVPSGAQTSKRSFAFSPGFHCPNSYTTVRVTSQTLGTVTETRAICCPVLDGIATLSNIALNYNPLTTPRLFYSTLGCTVALNQAYFLTVANNGTSTSWNFKAGNGINAYSVQIAWQSTDLSSISAATTPVTTTSNSASATPAPLISSGSSITSTMSTSSSSSSISTTPTPSPSAVSNNDLSLSTGTKITIGVLTPIVALAIILIVLLLIKRRPQRRSRDSRGLLDTQQGPIMISAELDAAKRLGLNAEELEAAKRLGINVAELDASKRSGIDFAELDATRR